MAYFVFHLCDVFGHIELRNTLQHRKPQNDMLRWIVKVTNTTLTSVWKHQKVLLCPVHLVFVQTLWLVETK